jgi:hypothetical protein
MRISDSSLKTLLSPSASASLNGPGYRVLQLLPSSSDAVSRMCDAAAPSARFSSLGVVHIRRVSKRLAFVDCRPANPCSLELAGSTVADTKVSFIFKVPTCPDVSASTRDLRVG